jgi:hypothetical protein
MSNLLSSMAEWMSHMSIFDAVALVWLVSLVLVTFIGFFRGRTAAALDIGLFLGPIGLLLAVLMISRDRKHVGKGAATVRLNDVGQKLPATMVSETGLRRAA